MTTKKDLSEIAKKNQNQNQSGGFFNGMMFGTAVGAAAYYIFGTKEGQKLKEQLVNLSKEHYEKFQQTQTGQQLKAQADPIVQKTTKKVKKVVKQTKKTAKNIEKQAKTTHKQVVKTAKTTHKKVEKTIDVVKKDVDKELKQLQNTVSQAQKKADVMEKNLKKAANRIEKKFFMRKGKSLGK